MAEEYMTIGEAQKLLGVSKVKMSHLVKDGTLKTIADPLDARSKLVRKEEVVKLIKRSK